MKQNIAKLYSLHEQIDKLKEDAHQFGLSTFGDAFEHAGIDEDGVMWVYEDCGHEFDSDESFYDKEGEEVE